MYIYIQDYLQLSYSLDKRAKPISVMNYAKDWLVVLGFNPFPLDKILDQTKLKAFEEDTLNVTKMIISVFDRVENIVGKGEIACTSKAISPFPTMFSKGFFS